MRKVKIDSIKIRQPIGEFYIGVISYQDLLDISYVDRRTLNTELDDFMGIQRHLSKSRVKTIQEYVNNIDATFPNAIIVSMRQENCEWLEDERRLEIFSTENIELGDIAKIIDGQHRVEGMKGYEGKEKFDLPVTIFVEVDVATQANIFATVNLAQTKVNRSLAYDLFSYEKVRSPQKSCHEITVALNNKESSPFYKRIKRLGVATPGVRGETLTQAAVVESLLSFISRKPTEDRNSFLRKIWLSMPDEEESVRLPFRKLWLSSDEDEIARIIFNYFTAVVRKWPSAWNDLDTRGNVLPKTNGFKALMRFLHAIYPKLSQKVPTIDEFYGFLKPVPLEDDDFNITTFPPGSSGEAILRRILEDSIVN